MSIQHEGRRLRIAFLTSEPAYDRHSHSGSLYYMGKALEQHCGDVTYLKYVASWERRILGRIMRELPKHHVTWQIAYRHLLFVARKDAKIATQRLDGQQFDVIIAPDCAPIVAFLRTTVPILLPLDVTFRLQRGYYPAYVRLLAFSARQGETLERMAFQRASRLLFSSPWAARSAVKDYGIDPQKVHAVFWGANLDHTPSREQVLAKKPSGKCRMLFMGVDWHRKGGAIAYETLLKLDEMGIKAELIICGTEPPPGTVHERMKVIPYLDKNDETQAHKIEELYIMSDFLILPTRADCLPAVFREAGAFGIPVITTNTGGVADAIRNGENGYALPIEAGGEAYAKIIADIYRDEPHYLHLVRSSRANFEERLNWDVWGKVIHMIIQEVVSSKKNGSGNKKTKEQRSCQRV